MLFQKKSASEYQTYELHCDTSLINKDNTEDSEEELFAEQEKSIRQWENYSMLC